MTQEKRPAFRGSPPFWIITLVLYPAGWRMQSPFMPGGNALRGASRLAWDGHDAAIGACLGIAFLAGVGAALILVHRRLAGGPTWGTSALLAGIWLNVGLDWVLAGRPGFAPGLAATQAAAMLACWTYYLARLAAETVAWEESTDLNYIQILPFGLAWTTAWWGLRATQVAGSGIIVAALAAPVGARMLAGVIVADRAYAAFKRREIQAARKRRLAAESEGANGPAVPPGA